MDTCHWKTDLAACAGEVKQRVLFDLSRKLPWVEIKAEPITVTVCDRHFHQHEKIMSLYKSGRTMEEILANPSMWDCQCPSDG